jgi:hypothetical protein
LIAETDHQSDCAFGRLRSINEVLGFNAEHIRVDQLQVFLAVGFAFRNDPQRAGQTQPFFTVYQRNAVACGPLVRRRTFFWSEDFVCIFVLCNRHWFNKVRGP